MRGAASRSDSARVWLQVQLTITSAPAEYCLPMKNDRQFKPHFQVQVWRPSSFPLVLWCGWAAAGATPRLALSAHALRRSSASGVAYSPACTTNRDAMPNARCHRELHGQSGPAASRAVLHAKLSCTATSWGVVQVRVQHGGRLHQPLRLKAYCIVHDEMVQVRPTPCLQARVRRCARILPVWCCSFTFFWGRAPLFSPVSRAPSWLAGPRHLAFFLCLQLRSWRMLCMSRGGRNALNILESSL